jgi:O-antigen/teichoic acid export membrane protein
MVCFVCTSANYIFGTLLTANGNLRELNIIAILAVILSVVLNLLLIPKYQAVGSAIASLSVHILVMLSQIFVVFKKIKVFPNLAYSFRLFLFVCGSILVALFSLRLNLGLGPTLLILVLGCLLVAVSVRFLPIREFYNILTGTVKE